ncbi:MAG: deoxycytidyl transferase [Chaenotheca gracillima]|nr:MAG: deoxycytidyl transferase [Chaenotheca gracillima]
MEPELGHIRARKQYEGEDTRLTSTKEIAGWYSYGWAAEVFVVCGVGSFIPITLEQLAREHGFLQSDRSVPCQSNFQAPVPGPNVTDTSLLSRVAPRPDKGQCLVHLFGTDINTASFALYTFSISVLLQALLIISMSGAADHGMYRKFFLVVLAVVGAVSTMLFIVVEPGVYLLGPLFAIVGNICFGASFVLLNSFLPLLVRNHPSVQESLSPAAFDERLDEDTTNSSLTAVENDDDDPLDSTLADSASSLLPSSRPDATTRMAPSASVTSPQLQLSTKISSYGIGIGYIAAVLLQTGAFFLVILTGSTTFSLRLVLFIIGAWWLIFTIPAAFWLRPRPGPPLPNPNQTALSYIAYAWRSLARTISRARRLKDVLLFLLAWFLLSDGIATVSGTAVLFAKTELGMPPAQLALIGLIATVFGIFGAFTWSKVSRLAGLTPSQTILACIFIFELIPLYGLIGFIPAVQDWGVFGLQQPWEMYLLGAVYGIVLGGLSSYCRSLFGELIPPGSEAAFYALYAITDKGSSVFGPAIVGAITDRTGGIRPAFIFLAVLVGLPAPIMYLVDVDRGRKAGKKLAEDLLEEAKARKLREEPSLLGNTAVTTPDFDDDGDDVERRGLLAVTDESRDRTG